jgi:hypothetical protein
MARGTHTEAGNKAAANEAEAGVPGWTGRQRHDGAQVHRHGDAWTIALVPRAAAIEHCPCCGKRFTSARSAMLVANAILPAPARH